MQKLHIFHLEQCFHWADNKVHLSVVPSYLCHVAGIQSMSSTEREDTLKYLCWTLVALGVSETAIFDHRIIAQMFEKLPQCRESLVQIPWIVLNNLPPSTTSFIKHMSLTLWLFVLCHRTSTFNCELVSILDFWL